MVQGVAPQEHEAHWMKVASSVRLVRPLFSEHEDRINGQVVRSLEGYVLAGCPQEFYHMVSWPRTWWQHLKRDVLSRWTANPSTPLGRWIDSRISWIDLVYDEKVETFYAKVCPHGAVEADPSKHLRFLTYDADSPHLE